MAIGSDANDGLPFEVCGNVPFFNVPGCIYGIDPTSGLIEGAPWSYYSSLHSGAGGETDYGSDTIVPAQSPWLEGASKFILWDGDNPLGKKPSGYQQVQGTSVHNWCLVANLWVWNRLIEHIEGRFDSRSDGAVFGQLIYSREDAISGGADASNPEPMFIPQVGRCKI